MLKLMKAEAVHNEFVILKRDYRDLPPLNFVWLLKQLNISLRAKLRWQFFFKKAATFQWVNGLIKKIKKGAIERLGLLFSPLNELKKNIFGNVN